MRRREAGRGAAPAGLVATRHSGGVGAPPGTTKSPCQELADSQARPLDVPLESAARRLTNRRCGAPRGARVFRRRDTAPYGFALFGAPLPSSSKGDMIG